jgi:hypothetical protein
MLLETDEAWFGREAFRIREPFDVEGIKQSHEMFYQFMEWHGYFDYLINKRVLEELIASGLMRDY